MEAEILAAMSRANVPPEFAYAYRKTGLLGLSSDKSLWPPENIKEWNDAVDEYRAIQARPDKPKMGQLLGGGQILLGLGLIVLWWLAMAVVGQANDSSAGPEKTSPTSRVGCEHHEGLRDQRQQSQAENCADVDAHA
jgi:hypothetical protein